jgi:hypothetical protein
MSILVVMGDNITVGNIVFIHVLDLTTLVKSLHGMLVFFLFYWKSSCRIKGLASWSSTSFLGLNGPFFIALLIDGFNGHSFLSPILHNLQTHALAIFIFLTFVTIYGHDYSLNVDLDYL